MYIVKNYNYKRLHAYNNNNLTPIQARARCSDIHVAILLAQNTC